MSETAETLMHVKQGELCSKVPKLGASVGMYDPIGHFV